MKNEKLISKIFDDSVMSLGKMTNSICNAIKTIKL